MMTSAPRRLNLGCGDDIWKGWINLDILALPGVDVVHDLENTPLPFPSNTFDEIYTSHVLEHIENIIPLMKELYRVLKPNGIVRIVVPYFASPAYHLNPTHKRKYNLRTFWFFCGNDTYGARELQADRVRLSWLSNRGFMKSHWYAWPVDFLLNLFPNIYERLFVYYLPAAELHVQLHKVKVAGKPRHIKRICEINQCNCCSRDLSIAILRSLYLGMP